jgi:lysozyme
MVGSLMRWEDHLVEQLKRQEGWRDHAYPDHLGFWTIGYGRLIDKRKGGRITKMEGEMLLTNDIREKIAELRQNLPWFDSRPDHVKQALTNMAFQMGIAGLLKFKRTLAMVEAGDYEAAADNAANSLWAREQTPNRAREVLNLLRGRT